MFGISAFITYVFAMLAMPRRGLHWAMLGYFAVCYLTSYNVVRQEIAAAICMLALACRLKRWNWAAVFLFVFACLFHTSTLIVFPAVVLVVLALRIGRETVVTIFVLLALVSFLFNPAEMALSLVKYVPGAESYLSYGDDVAFMGSGVANTGLGYLLWEVVFATMGFYFLFALRRKLCEALSTV